MFGPFWIARHTARAFTPRRRYRSCSRNTPSSSNGGAGCLIVFVGLLILGGILGEQNQAQQPTPVAAAPGWAPGPNGTFVETHIPVAPIAVAAPATPNLTAGILITATVIIAILGGLALIGSRMAPAPIKVRARVDDYQPCCGVPHGATHAAWCPTLPPDHPQAWYSNRR